jgi:flagellin
MSRINTNVSSLVAQKTLARSNAQLQESLTRLSTGLRINSGKDDPAGLIASENLRRDITSINKAISNTERADQLIGTADSALGQISNLLNDIRGLVVEAANTGVLSDEQVAANQLQVDSSLEAIDRIAKVTNFQGRKLLDGSLDFTVSYSSGAATVRDLSIEQANLGTAGSLAVSVDVTTAATQGTLTATVPVAAGAVASSVLITFNDTSSVTVTGTPAGAALNGVAVNVVNDTNVTAGSALAVYDDANDEINVYVNGDTTSGAIATAINGLTDFNAVAGGGGVGFVVANDGYGTKGSTTGGSDAVTGILADLVVRIGGNSGSEVFNFDTGASGTQIRDAINLVSDSTGVSAAYAGTTLTLTSTQYGSDQFVDVEVLSEGGGGTFGSSLSATHDAGSDIIGTINGYQATGRGNTLSINTAALDLNLTVTDGSSTDVAFTITGGGAVFQLGPNVVTNQQSRIGISAVNTGKLGGATGRLYELGSGQANDLSTDPTDAAKIVDEAINKITGVRGRLGAFQRTTLETNINSLNDTVTNLTGAESSIRDADFAAETAALTRAQILVQSGTSVLAIANQNPQNVLALLRNA